MSDLPTRDQIKNGVRVSIETKKNQGTGRFTEGTVEKILTSNRFHPHGTKVILDDGQIGRVKKILSGTDQKSVDSPTDRFVDLTKMNIPKIEDVHNEFKEFYQYDNAIEYMYKLRKEKRESAIKAKKIEVQERFATAVCSFGNSRTGGFVYLGVNSEGKAMGLEKDLKFGKFLDYSDSFANHIRDRLLNLLKDRAFITSKLGMVFRNVGGKTICIIQVLPSGQPLFLHTSNGEMFFVRGPAPRAENLTGQDQFRYIKDRFPDYE